jgi:glutaredoxin
MIKIYGKPGCGKCEAAKKKLELLGLEFEVKTLADFTKFHDGWQSDSSVEVLAAWSYFNDMPLLKIDGAFYSYAGAIKKLKGK